MNSTTRRAAREKRDERWRTREDRDMSEVFDKLRRERQLYEAPRTGWDGHMLQDESRGLSKWLAGRPDSMLNTREAAENIRQEREQQPLKPIPSASTS